MFIFEAPKALRKKGDVISQTEGKPQERYILYFDILGYKAYFDSKENDVMEFLHSSLSLVDDIGEEAEHAQSFSTNLRYKTFSDNFIFIVDEDKQDEYVLYYLVQLAAHLQLNFLAKYKITVRGAICFGQVYFDEKIVFGEGLVKAVGLEGSANYPRIIVDDEIIKTWYPAITKWSQIRQDKDDVYYIDYFYNVKCDNVFNPDKTVKTAICRLRNSVHALIEKHGHYDGRISEIKKVDESSKVIIKYLWLLLKYNEMVEREKIPAAIKYNIEINKKLFRFELTNVDKVSWPISAN